MREIEVTGNRIDIEVENIQTDKNRVLENALVHEVDIVKFEIHTDTLEEIFLQLVVK